MDDDMRQANFITKPHFKNANANFIVDKIPKAAKMKRIPSGKQHEGVRGLRKFLANEAWW